ncbi:MAG: hypothetical protein R2739_09360 [Chitinophagales bacterium]
MINQQNNKTDFYLHMVCFDVPFPANYGGAIESFYKIKSLHQLGVKIYLHCFVYDDRREEATLEQYCEKVFYYKRERKIKDIFSKQPFIVKSRANEKLLANLIQYDFPILFDATHCTAFIDHPALSKRKKVVRLHNIEWIYYRILLQHAVSLKDKLFFFQEYKKLRKYDEQFRHADALSCLSQTDFEYYKDKFPDKKVQLNFVFHENENIKSKIGKGDYILYHGNLSLSDNYSLVLDILHNDLKDCKHKIILAGKNPPNILADFVAQKSNIELIANPTNESLLKLIQDAHICLALAANPSGVKLKLINSLFNARFVISDDNTLTGSGLDALVYKTDETPLPELVDKLMKKTFTQDEIFDREKILMEKYNNQKNAQHLLNLFV